MVTAEQNTQLAHRKELLAGINAVVDRCAEERNEFHARMTRMLPLKVHHGDCTMEIYPAYTDALLNEHMIVLKVSRPDWFGKGRKKTDELVFSTSHWVTFCRMIGPSSAPMRSFSMLPRREDWAYVVTVGSKFTTILQTCHYTGGSDFLRQMYREHDREVLLPTAFWDMVHAVIRKSWQNVERKPWPGVTT